MPKTQRADGRVDCPVCGTHASRCQSDHDDGLTYCELTGRRVPEGNGEMLALAVKHDQHLLSRILAQLKPGEL